MKQDPSKWAMHVYCQSKDCGYNAEGHCQKDYISIDDWQTCEDHEEEEEPE